LIKKFLKALLHAQKFLERNKENAIDVTIKEMGIERKKEIICDWEKINFKLSLNQSLLITLEDQARWATENKFTNKKTIPNYLNYFYINSLKSVKPEAVSVGATQKSCIFFLGRKINKLNFYSIYNTVIRGKFYK